MVLHTRTQPGACCCMRTEACLGVQPPPPGRTPADSPIDVAGIMRRVVDAHDDDGGDDERAADRPSAPEAPPSGQAPAGKNGAAEHGSPAAMAAPGGAGPARSEPSLGLGARAASGALPPWAGAEGKPAPASEPAPPARKLSAGAAGVPEGRPAPEAAPAPAAGKPSQGPAGLPSLPARPAPRGGLAALPVRPAPAGRAAPSSGAHCVPACMRACSPGVCAEHCRVDDLHNVKPMPAGRQKCWVGGLMHVWRKAWWQLSPFC